MPTAFNCSMCSAPLDLTNVSGLSMRCPYCGNTVILPEELRSSGGVNHQASEFSGIPFAPMVDQALKLAEVAQRMRAGQKIAAIKLYRETFGCGLKEAKEAVEQMETGQPIVFTQTNYKTGNTSGQSFPTTQLPGQVVKQTKRVGLWITFIVLAFLGGIGWIISHAISTAFSSAQRNIPMAVPGNSTSAPGFAKSVFEFGSEGIGAGQFKDARSIAIDGEGHIYVGEYEGGRVQVFDHDGKFITQWMADPKKALLNLAVDRKGTVYVVHPSVILRYEGTTGKLLGEVAKPAPNRSEFYSDVFVALDGSLYAIGSNSNIIHFGPGGEVKSIIKVADKVGDDVSFDKIAVDGSGNIYALEDHQESVFKFAPDGKYINRFGGKGKEAGQLTSPHNLAVDGQGRIYVSDLGRGVQIFDSNGRYIDSFGGHEVIFGLAINDRNEIYAAERNHYKIVKYVLSK